MEDVKCAPINYCIIIPTYNNEKTLKQVIDGVLKVVVSSKVIIVEDGATDSTKEILKEYTELTQVHHDKNRGKGMALRNGFKKALSMGFTHAITIDSDGQHFPEDIPLLIAASEKEPEALFIGSRNMQQDGIPNKSSFGNKFSNFWFWFETGIKLQDTQSGFRIYPISIMPKKWVTWKFEFEIESIVRSAWKDIPVKNIPIQIKYEPKETRVSHFRPFKDFTRISILNTVLVSITLIYILPRNFFRSFKKKSFKKFILEDVLGSNDSPKIKALSLALGVFIGILPIWGLQTLAVIGLAVILRLNKLLAFAASNISIPPMIPVIVLASLKIGSMFLGHEFVTKDYLDFSNMGNNLMDYIVGSIILASAMAFIVGFTSYGVLILMQKRKNG
ncbi:MAG: DUF2062 domain-containing protein [Brumimicrobium sp.]|nr:DUF2062 domain-containing protein [Brumimicrobium sp.]